MGSVKVSFYLYFGNHRTRLKATKIRDEALQEFRCNFSAWHPLYTFIESHSVQNLVKSQYAFFEMEIAHVSTVKLTCCRAQEMRNRLGTGKSVQDTETLLKIEDHLKKENFHNKMLLLFRI